MQTVLPKTKKTIITQMIITHLLKHTHLLKQWLAVKMALSNEKTCIQVKAMLKQRFTSKERAALRISSVWWGWDPCCPGDINALRHVNHTCVSILSLQIFETRAELIRWYYSEWNRRKSAKLLFIVIPDRGIACHLYIWVRRINGPSQGAENVGKRAEKE